MGLEFSEELGILDRYKMKSLRFFETSETEHPVMQLHASEQRNPQPNRCEKLKIRNSA
jgi:hypothetical protein